MANEKEVEMLESLITSMKSASDALVKIYPTASLTLKYMSDDVKILIADLKGRESPAEESQRRVLSREEMTAKQQAGEFNLQEEQDRLFGRSFVGGQKRPLTAEEMTAAQKKIFEEAH